MDAGSGKRKGMSSGATSLLHLTTVPIDTRLYTTKAPQNIARLHTSGRRWGGGIQRTPQGSCSEGFFFRQGSQMSVSFARRQAMPGGM
jgi:hypothetical protein